MRPLIGAMVLLLLVELNSALWNPGPTCKRRYPPKQCEFTDEEGWFQIGPDYCIKVFQKALTFRDAEYFCREASLFYEGHLVSIHNIKEFHHVMCTMYRSTTFKAHYWIGLSKITDMFGFWEWGWTDGSSGGYLRWARGQPDNFLKKESCVEMNHDDWGLYNDESCYHQKPFVCGISNS